MGKISKKIKFLLASASVRKVTMPESKKSFLEFFAPISNILAEENVFVSQGIMKDVWALCEKHNGNIQTSKIDEGKNQFLFESSLLKLKAVFEVDSNQPNPKQIQLIELSTPKINYKNKNKKLAKKFYFCSFKEKEKAKFQESCK